MVSERDKLIEEQTKDPEVARLAQEAVDNDELELTPEGYFKQSDVLMRKWRPRDVPATDTWRTVYQIVVPQSKRQDVLSMAHETALAGHLGINNPVKTLLQDLARKGPFFLHPCKILQDLARSCKILRDLAGSCGILQESCKILARNSCKIPARFLQNPTRSRKIPQDLA